MRSRSKADQNVSARHISMCPGDVIWRYKVAKSAKNLKTFFKLLSKAIKTFDRFRIADRNYKTWFNSVNCQRYEPSKLSNALREKCPNAEFFLVRIFLHLDWIRRFTEFYRVNLRIQSKYRKIRTRENSIFEHFSRSDDVIK